MTAKRIVAYQGQQGLRASSEDETPNVLPKTQQYPRNLLYQLSIRPAGAGYRNLFTLGSTPLGASYYTL